MAAEVAMVDKAGTVEVAEATKDPASKTDHNKARERQVLVLPHPASPCSCHFASTRALKQVARERTAVKTPGSPAVRGDLMVHS